MGRGVKQAFVVFKHVLGAVAVMDVEIDHRDPVQPVPGASVERPDGDRVEQAKAHGVGRFGVVPGRADGAKGVFPLALHHPVDGIADGPRGPARRFAGGRRHAGVGVQGDAAFLGHVFKNLLDVIRLVHLFDFLEVDDRGLVALQGLEIVVLEPLHHGPQPVRAFGMATPGIVFDADGVGI